MEAREQESTDDLVTEQSMTSNIPVGLIAEGKGEAELGQQQTDALFESSDSEEEDEIGDDRIAELEKRFGVSNNASTASSSSFRRSSFRMSVRSSLTVAHDSAMRAVPPENAISQVLAAAFVVN